MKFICSLLLFILVFLSSSAKSISEDFDFFLSQFATDSVFQLERTLFPLKYITWKDSNEIGGEIVIENIQKDEWIHDFFFFDKMSYRPQISDNFNGKLRNTNKRLFEWIGIENGVSVKYFFKRIKGNWFLIKKENLGD